MIDYRAGIGRMLRINIGVGVVAAYRSHRCTLLADLSRLFGGHGRPGLRHGSYGRGLAGTEAAVIYFQG